MERWIAFVIASFFISFILKWIVSIVFFQTTMSSSSTNQLPPGPSMVALLAKVLFPPKFSSGMETVLLDLKSKYGPIFTIRIGSLRAIFISSHSMTHTALIKKAAVFSDRPKLVTTLMFLKKRKQHNITLAPYGPTWRLLRRNLTTRVLHMSYSDAKCWARDILTKRLLEGSTGPHGRRSMEVKGHFQYATLCLLVFMCLGERLDEKKMCEIQSVVYNILRNASRSTAINLFPSVGKILFRGRYKELKRWNQNEEDVLIPLIKSRIKKVRQMRSDSCNRDCASSFSVAYVDTLMDLELPEEKRRLNDQEISSLCGEFLMAGTDTTSNTLEWIMANLVKYPHIQLKLYEEIKQVVGSRQNIKEEDINNMPYLKAVVLEGLRRHPPTHFGLPHAVSTEGVDLDGYNVPTNTMVFFMLAEMGWDPAMWEEPMVFKPERFLTTEEGHNSVDLTGHKGIKMIPFGAGRRTCPGSGMAMQNLHFFVANLVHFFEWTSPEDGEVDLSENHGIHTGMKNPLRAYLWPRAN